MSFEEIETPDKEIKTSIASVTSLVFATLAILLLLLEVLCWITMESRHMVFPVLLLTWPILLASGLALIFGLIAVIIIQLMKRPLKGLKQAIISICLTSFCLLFWYILWIEVVAPNALSEACAAKLRNISEKAFGDFNTDYLFIDGKPYFKDKLNLNATASEKLLICPACKEPYIYSAIAPSGNRIPGWTDSEKRNFHFFIMWCPKPCHFNKRNFLRWDHSCLPPLSDNEVSWYYQREVITMTKEELVKENEYLKSHNIEILQNNR
jgi:hypothetical protein